MKKFLFTIVALLAVSAVSAQSPRTIAEAQALYDNTVIDQRRAVEEAKSEERLTVDAAESRLNLVKSDLQEVKENYRRVVEELGSGIFRCAFPLEVLELFFSHILHKISG
mgnify:CR=1 FL=1